ncbi:MAG: PHP domain-containing protein [Calditrichaeota bacterium]|nr:MAG: PHP domain-containing protein [Calditrichota bacterium]
MNAGPVDLHLHTNRSDGVYAPRELLDKVAGFGLRTVAIVDHDEVSAIPEAVEYAKKLGIEIIPGIELSVIFGGYDLHLLGYCFDYENAELLHYLHLFRSERVKRAEKIVDKLSDLGMPISLEAVLERAGQGSVGRPHIASVLVDDGFVFSFQEAFDKYLATGKPAYVDKYKMDVVTALNLIKNAGGLCSVAHPGIQVSESELMDLVKLGIDAIEVVHPKHSDEQTRFYRKVASENGLLQTGGSDFHGGPKGEDALGRFTVDYEVVLQMKALVGCGL